jgi:hypothetical protein
MDKPDGEELDESIDRSISTGVTCYIWPSTPGPFLSGLMSMVAARFACDVDGGSPRPDFREIGRVKAFLA